MTEVDILSWMERAIALARQAETIDEVPVGAVLVHENRILAEGLNRRETTQSTVGHAELAALQHYNTESKSWRLPPGTSLFVTVEPCLMCTGAMISARLTNIYFGCADTKNAGLSRIQSLIDDGVFDHRFGLVVPDVKKKECAELLSNYFKKKRSG